MIRVNVVNGGDIAANALIYRPPDNRLLSFLNDNISKAVEYTSNAASGFANTVVNMYNKFNSSESLNAAKLMLYNAGTHLNQDIIYPVMYDNLGNANLIMQRYIISEPQMNNLYTRNMCYGYQDTYVDIDKGSVGKDRLDYQNVMDGVLQHDNDGNGYFNYYSNSDDTILHKFDKLAILETWDNVALMISNGLDPSDPDNNEL